MREQDFVAPIKERVRSLKKASKWTWAALANRLGESSAESLKNKIQRVSFKHTFYLVLEHILLNESPPE